MGLGQGNRITRRRAEAGYAMAALLVGLSIMAVLMTMAMPVWTTFNKREREAELIWRGQQYARAIGLFQRKYANTFPPNVDVLVEQRFLRKKYKDPITNEDFQMIPAGGGGNQPGSIQKSGSVQKPGGNQQSPSPFASPGASMTVGQGNGGTSQAPAGGLSPSGGNQPSIGIQGVVSKSADKSVKVYNGRTKYNEWAFIHVATSQQAGVTTGQGRNPNQNPNQQSPQSQNPFMSPGSNRPGIPNGPGFGQQQQPPPPGGRSLFGPATPPKGQ